MKFYKSVLATTVATVALSMGMVSCSDEFQELNQDPASIVTADPSFLFAQGVNKFEPMGYLLYYYNAPMTYTWSQMGVPTSGMTPNILTTTNTGDQGSSYLQTLKYVRDLENYFRANTDEAAVAAMPYLHALNVLTAYLGIFDSDMFGDLSFTEACLARYSTYDKSQFADGFDPIKPRYDSQKDLYDLWLKQLDEAMAAFTAEGASMNKSQDVVFGGDVAKWAKFANSLKLRIAVRLQAQDMGRAKQIVAAVKSAPCGYINSLDDEVLFNKATVVNTEGGNSGDDIRYHWNNGFLDGTAGTEHVVGLMVNNLDPRVRFCYQKNDWNSKIVEAYYSRGEEIPAFIEANVNYSEKDGKKHFESWKGAGEPWVRYYGLPMAYNPINEPAYNWYFHAGDHKIGKEDGSSQKAYQTYSQFQGMMINGRTYGVSVPTTPEDVLNVTNDPRPWYGLYLGAAEVNLYLAEFAMLEGNSAEAEKYYNAALEFSVKEYDKLAKLNKIAYYGTTYGYDPNEVSIELKNGEIETMLAQPQYAFTGTDAEKLEKIYVQQLLNFTLSPNEQFVTARRSGYPKFGSSILPRVEYADMPVNKIPRRFDTGTPVETDLRYSIIRDAYEKQGFSITSNGSGHSDKLHNERIWADQKAPEWGAGHNK